MNKLSSFTAELEKIAFRIPTALLLGGAGAGYGAHKGFKGFVKEEREDREKFRSGLITKKDLEKRKEMRRAKGYGSAAAGAVAGGMTPVLAKRLRQFVVSTAKESAEPIARKMENAGANITSAARRELSDALQKDSEKMVDLMTDRSRQMGRNLAEGMHDVSVGEGRPPLIRIKHEMGFGRV